MMLHIRSTLVTARHLPPWVLRENDRLISFYFAFIDGAPDRASGPVPPGAAAAPPSHSRGRPLSVTKDNYYSELRKVAIKTTNGRAAGGRTMERGGGTDNRAVLGPHRETTD